MFLLTYLLTYLQKARYINTLTFTFYLLIIIIIIIFYLPKKEASYQKSRSSSYGGRPSYNNS